MELKITYETQIEFVKAFKIEKVENGLKIYETCDNDFIIFNSDNAKIEILKF